MAATFRIVGLEELKRGLRQLPDELKDDAGALVRSHALNAAGGIRASYPRRVGKLQDGVVAEATHPLSPYGVRWVVKNKAPHAWLYEYGTQARHYITAEGKRHNTGLMPAAPPGRAFVPQMITMRGRLMDDLGWLLIRNGLAVRRAA